MKVIYTRTMRVKDDGLGKAMEIGKGQQQLEKNIILTMMSIFLFKWVEIQEQ